MIREHNLTIKGKNVAKKIQKNIFVKKGETSKSKKAMK